MTIVPADRTSSITYAIRDIAVKAQSLEKQGRKVLYLNIGDPPVYDFDTPQHIKEHLIKVVRNEHSKRKVATYADSIGLREAREAVASFLKKQEIHATVEDVVMTSGVSEGIMLAVAALINPGENLLVPCPNYPLYDATLKLFHGEPNYYKLDEERDWQIDFVDLEKKVNKKTKGIVVINPNNPTGAVYTEETLKKVVAFVKKHKLVIFADEVYDRLLIDKEWTHHPLAALAHDVPVLSFGGLSKNYIMPGYRVGWIHFHDPAGEMKSYVDAIRQLLRSRLSSPHLQQHAVAAALHGDHTFLADVLEQLRAKRNLTIEKLNTIPGIRCVSPHGAFYAFPSIQLPKGATDKQFVEQLLEETGVLVVYGSGFGIPEEEKGGIRYGHFRVVFLAKEKELAEAYAKIAEFTKRFYDKHHYAPK